MVDISAYNQNSLRGHDIICVSPSLWEQPWGSKQQLMSRLSCNNRVLYIEYQASILHLVWPSLRKRFLIFFGGLKKINGNIYVYTPPLLLLPFGYYLRWINKINQAILALFVLRQIKRLDFKDYILWVYPPSAVDLIGHIKPSFVVYHCAADFCSEKKIGLRRRTITVMEEGLARKAGLIAAMTPALFERLKRLNLNTIYFPSAVEFDYFYRTANEKSEVPEDLRGIKRPILGMVGYLDGNIFDLDLLDYLSSERPDWSLVLVGPLFKKKFSFGSLRKKKNVYFLGGKSHNEIPFYIKLFDVCLIPYKKNEFTANVSPLKLYEYLACGKPVVSSDFLNADECKGIITPFKTRQDFIVKIENALSENDADLVKRRIEIAKGNSWDIRLKTIERMLKPT